MAKKSVTVVSPDGEKVPFLRGVLVQSLTTRGLSFEDAYAMAQRVRDALAPTDEIDTDSLRDQVAELLEQEFGPEVRQAYESGREDDLQIMVRTPSREAPFSVGLLSRYLEGCAIGRENALSSARTVHEILRQRGASEIDSKELRHVIFDTLKRDCCAEAADHYISRCRFQDSRQPLIILIGGPPGAGKSTVTADVAYHLEIARTQSTDLIREIVRSYLAPQVVPTLGYSSFEAWKGLPEVEPLEQHRQPGNLVIAGFLSQVDTIKTALEATISRAIKEHQDLVVDGVHVIPSRMNLKKLDEDAVVVPITLAVTTYGQLARQLGRRSREQPDRRSSLHKEQLNAIWDIQTHMLDQAEKNGIPVIANWNIDDTVRRILEQVIKRIAARFPPDPASLG